MRKKKIHLFLRQFHLTKHSLLPNKTKKNVITVMQQQSIPIYFIYIHIYTSDVYVCVYLHTHTHTHTHTHSDTHADRHTHAHAHTRTRTHARTHTRTHTHMPANTHIW